MHALDINPIWFGLLLCVNMQTSFMHPPFGFALFYLRAIAPKEVKTKDIYWGSLPWIALQLVLVGILIFWPETVTYWIGEHEDARPGGGGTRRSRACRCPSPAAISARPTSASRRRSTSNLNEPRERLQHGGDSR